MFADIIKKQISARDQEWDELTRVNKAVIGSLMENIGLKDNFNKYKLAMHICGQSTSQVRGQKH